MFSTKQVLFKIAASVNPGVQTPKCGACELIIASEMGVLSRGSCELIIFKFVVVKAKISRFFLKGGL